MEEKQNNKKLSYDELSRAASDLHTQYQKLSAEFVKLRGEHQKAVEALNSRDFEYTSFFLSALFKVMEHPEMYKEAFVDWCSQNIEKALTSFVDSMNEQSGEGEGAEEGKEEDGDEA